MIKGWVIYFQLLLKAYLLHICCQWYYRTWVLSEDDRYFLVIDLLYVWQWETQALSYKTSMAILALLTFLCCMCVNDRHSQMSLNQELGMRSYFTWHTDECGVVFGSSRQEGHPLPFPPLHLHSHQQPLITRDEDLFVDGRLNVHCSP